MRRRLMRLGGHRIIMDILFSAYDVIKAIRTRAGLGLDNGDAYLESIKDNKDKMRELIRNELPYRTLF